MSTNGQEAVTPLIKRRHPTYTERRGEWGFFLQSYMGGKDYITPDNLFQYFKEGDIEYAQRRKRAYRENHTKRVVDLINSYLFKAPADRNYGENEVIKAFYDDMDGQGSNVGQFMKAVSLWSSVFGRAYVVIDKPELSVEEITGTAQDDLKAFPYCWILHPDKMLDIAFDQRGNIKWALVLEHKRDDDDPFTSTGEVKDQYRLWTPFEWYLFDDAGNEVQRQEHGLGIVPIVPVDNEDKNEYDGQSLVGDIVYIDRAVFNNWSRLDTIVNDQTFSQLIFPIQGLAIEEAADNYAVRQKYITLATNRVLLWDAQAGVEPKFISPDAGQASFILDMIERQVKQLYSVQGLAGETATEVTAQSGTAKAYDFDKLNKLLASKADNLEEAETRILEIFKVWMGGMSVETLVDYPDNFDVETLADEIERAQALALLDISETFKKEIDKALVLKALPKLDPKVLATIMEEIESREEDEEVALAQAGVGGMNQPEVEEEEKPLQE